MIDSLPRKVFWISGERSANGGFIPSIVEYDEPGHQLLAGNPDDPYSRPWEWGNDIATARSIASQCNRDDFAADEATAEQVILSALWNQLAVRDGHSYRWKVWMVSIPDAGLDRIVVHEGNCTEGFTSVEELARYLGPEWVGQEFCYRAANADAAAKKHQAVTGQEIEDVYFSRGCPCTGIDHGEIPPV